MYIRFANEDVKTLNLNISKPERSSSFSGHDMLFLGIYYCSSLEDSLLLSAGDETTTDLCHRTRKSAN